MHSAKLCIVSLHLVEITACQLSLLHLLWCFRVLIKCFASKRWFRLLLLPLFSSAMSKACHENILIQHLLPRSLYYWLLACCSISIADSSKRTKEPALAFKEVLVNLGFYAREVDQPPFSKGKWNSVNRMKSSPTLFNNSSVSPFFFGTRID